MKFSYDFKIIIMSLIFVFSVCLNKFKMSDLSNASYSFEKQLLPDHLSNFACLLACDCNLGACQGTNYFDIKL